MDFVFELLVGALGLAVYGTVKRPRHPIVRYVVRFIAFAGALFLLYWMWQPNSLTIPTIALVIWALCGVTVTLAELEFGQPRIAFAAWGLAIILLIVAVKRGFEGLRLIAGWALQRWF